MSAAPTQLDIFSPDPVSDLQNTACTPEPSLQYTVRSSSRAKRMQLRVLPIGQVEVVLPKRMSRKHVAPFVAQHQVWIKRELDQLAQKFPRSPELDLVLPMQVYLPISGLQLQVLYSGLRTCRQENVLTIRAGEKTQQQESLRRWLFNYAKSELPTRFQQVAEPTGLLHGTVRIRRQRTLWGSCTARKNISLNCNLLFLPAELVHYVFIHELCHTIHLNHSRRFWLLVESFLPDYRRLEHELKLASRHIPIWSL